MYTIENMLLIEADQILGSISVWQCPKLYSASRIPTPPVPTAIFVSSINVFGFFCNALRSSFQTCTINLGLNSIPVRMGEDFVQYNFN